MNLRQQAESDLQYILGDSVTGFGWPITVTDPNGTSGQLTGATTDISQVVDPETGQVVSGRSASVAIRTASIFGVGFNSLPVAVTDKNSKPWLVRFSDINGSSYTFKVIQSNPDRTLGIVTCILEAYTATGDNTTPDPFTGTSFSWLDFVTRAEYVSEEGAVLIYVFKGVEIFRHIPDPYEYALDAFYSDRGLTNLLARRS